MLLGFKRQFAPFVEDHSKTHTIRGFGKRRPFRVGDICHCYVDPRQKTMRLLGRWPCVRVEDIHIEAYGHPSVPLIVYIAGHPLHSEEANMLFLRDGFRDLTGETYQHIHQAAEFWKGRLPFVGHIIHWNPEVSA